jgi:polyisoprenoid-binding protein YceI
VSVFQQQVGELFWPMSKTAGQRLVGERTVNQLLRTMLPVLALVVGSWTPVASQAFEADFEPEYEVIDIGIASVRFQVRLFGLARIVGHFDRFFGKLVNNADWENESVRMHIDVSSINTNDNSRDDFLRSATFFDAERYPQIIFSNTRLIHDKDRLRQIAGDLSLHGTTRPVVFDVESADSDKEFDTSSFQAKVKIKRSDYGLNAMRPIVSDEVEIIVAMQSN